ncbi:hypothetical protein GCM10028832_40170 [Streptomyces sparsus]
MLNRTTAAAAALLLGGGGLVAANVYASAGTSKDRGGTTRDAPARADTVSTIACPEVADRLVEVPDSARAEVDRNLALLDSQVADAYKRLNSSQRAIQNDPNFVNNAILGPLRSKRAATIDRIAISIGRAAERPRNLDPMADCEVRDDVAAPAPDEGEGQGDNQGQGGGGDQGQDQGQGGGDQGGNQGQGDGQGEGEGDNGGGQPAGPSPEDFVDITTVQPNVSEPRNRRNASTGTFTTECGTNENGLFNSDNVIVAPGVSNGAHHMHDYVGNQGNNGFASDEDLANARTTCVNQEDQSSYFWPVLRLQNGQDEQDANEPGGGQDGNVGEIQQPSSVTLSFEGNPRGKVTAMPRFLRIITGDAKAFTNGPDNANASWSCTGFEDRQLKDRYPICPEGSEVVRTFRFQSCWDGENIDSANHRTHVAFADRKGRCGNGFRAIPQMVQRVTYDIPPGPGFAVDSFPEQLHKPITDHGDFINVMSEGLMNKAVDCINSGQNCTN